MDGRRTVGLFAIVTITVIGLTTMGTSDGKPKLIVSDATLTEGSEATLSCYVTGRGNYKLSWEWKTKKKDIKLKKVRIRRRNLAASKTIDLTFRKVNRDDCGIYYCLLRQGRKVIYGITKMNVLYVPEFIGHRGSTMAAVGDGTAQIECSFRGNPVPIIFWYKDDTQLQGYSIDYSGVPDVALSKITVSTLRNESFGTYVCTGENSLGSRNIQRVLVQTYTPGKPLELAIERKDYASLKLLIIPPVDTGGRPLTDVEVQWKNINQQFFNNSVDHIRIWKKRELLYAYIDNLRPHTRYSVRVQARNKHGYGPWAYLNFTTNEKPFEKPVHVSRTEHLKEEDQELTPPPDEATQTTVIVTVSTVAVSVSILVCAFTALAMKLEKRKLNTEDDCDDELDEL